VADTELRERAVAQFMLNHLHQHGFVLGGLGGLREHGITDLFDGRVVLATADSGSHVSGLKEVRDFLGPYLYGTTHRQVPGIGLVEEPDRDPWPSCTFAMEYDDRTSIKLELGTAERIGSPILTDIGPVAGLDDLVRPAMVELSSPGASNPNAYLMVDAIRRSGRLSDDRLLELASTGDPDFIRGHLVHSLENSNRWSARDFDLPGDQLEADELRDLGRRCTDWATDIVRSVRPDDRFDPFLADRVPLMAERNTISAADLVKRIVDVARPARGAADRSAKPDADNVTYVDPGRWRRGPRCSGPGRERS
jgi:hypothetical protein